MFGKKNHVDIELNADVERLLKSAKEGVLPIVEAGGCVSSACATTAS